jgi:Fe2+ transport system protein FeoA
MEQVISMDWQGESCCFHSREMPASETKQPAAEPGNFPLRLANEGEWVRIVSIDRGKGVSERLAGYGLRAGAEVQVLQNSTNGKLLLGHQGVRLYLGGSMAHTIRVAIIQGENK